MKPTILLVQLICVILFVACQNNEAEVKIRESYSLMSLDSKKITFDKKDDILTQNYNKPYLMIFLTTWCKYCLGQAQHLGNLHKDFGDKINIYGIFVDKDENLDTLKKFVEQSSTAFTWFYKGDISKLVETYHIQTFPFILLYDKNGNLVMSYDGLTPEEMVAFDIKKIL